eukprot:EG_transcript_17760
MPAPASLPLSLCPHIPTRVCVCVCVCAQTRIVNPGGGSRWDTAPANCQFMLSALLLPMGDWLPKPPEWHVARCHPPIPLKPHRSSLPDISATPSHLSLASLQ